MEWIEIRARSVAEAVERALDALGVHESELEYDVVEEPRSSLFGLRHTDAHIRARVKPLSREKPSERRRRKGRDENRGRGREGGERRPAEARSAATSGDGPKRSGGGGGRGRSGGRGGASGASGAAGSATESAKQRAAAARDADEPTTTPMANTAATGAGAADASETDESTGATGTKRRRRGGRGRGGAHRERAGGLYDDDRNDEEITEMPDPAAVEAIAADTRTFVEGLLDAIDLPGEVVITTDEVAVQCSVEGDQLGVLVGAQGATLAAIEELLRDAVGHRAPGVRLHLDVAGYRARRRAALAEFAVRVANEVIATGSAKALEPMPAADRKVVHDAVAELTGVATTSEGEEPRRRVVIKPAG